MDALEFIKEYDLRGTRITSIYCYTWEEDGTLFSSLSFTGDLGPDEKEYRHYSVFFSRSRSDFPAAEINSLSEALLREIEVSRTGKGYEVRLLIGSPDEEMKLDFTCEYFHAGGRHYLGFDYTNIYGTPEFKKVRAGADYAESPEYFREETVTELPGGFSLYEKKYVHKEDHAIHAYFNRCELRKEGRCIYEYTSFDGHHKAYSDLICHSNGHRYYPFHICLYGISYIDVDTLQVFHYVPRGMDHNYDLPYGESFIVTDIHYDPASDLVAYEGCYWAGAYDTMVGNLSDPMNFDPHLAGLRDHFLEEFDDDEFCDVDFVSWDSDGLHVKLDNGCQKTLSISQLREFIDAKRSGDKN